MPFSKELLEFATGLSKADDPFETFSKLTAKLGVQGSSYGFSVLRFDFEKGNRNKNVFFQHSFPKEWESQVGSGPFLDLDPGIDALMTGQCNYEWHPPDFFELIQQMPKQQRRQVEIEVDLGMNYGMTMMLETGKPGFSAMGLWFENPKSCDAFQRDWAHVGPTLQKAGHLLDSHIKDKQPNYLVGLTPREIDALSFLLAGHRASEICWKMSISEKTLEKHMLNARLKLKARTRDQALAKALLLGLIKP